MMIDSDNPELQDKGRNNLISAFGNLAKANEYLVEYTKK
jgi:hypothetical protein